MILYNKNTLFFDNKQNNLENEPLLLSLVTDSKKYANITDKFREFSTENDYTNHQKVSGTTGDERHERSPKSNIKNFT
jgi:hypothetical protein